MHLLLMLNILLSFVLFVLFSRKLIKDIKEYSNAKSNCMFISSLHRINSDPIVSLDRIRKNVTYHLFMSAIWAVVFVVWFIRALIS